MATSEQFEGVTFTKGRSGKLWGWFHDGTSKRRMSLEEAQAMTEKPKKKKAKKAAAAEAE